MAYEFDRNILDAALTKTKALPAAGANNNHDTIDLGAGGNHQPENAALEIVVPATASLVDDKTITFTVQDSPDDSTFTATGQSFVVTGAGGAGGPATTKRFSLPRAGQRYLRVNQAVLAAGGDNTAVSTTVKILT